MQKQNVPDWELQHDFDYVLNKFNCLKLADHLVEIFLLNSLQNVENEIQAIINIFLKISLVFPDFSTFYRR